MPNPQEAPARAETDIAISERARSKTERAVLGKSPYGSMVRIVLGILLFIAVFGTVFFFVQR
jgi:hypothetical protein